MPSTTPRSELDRADALLLAAIERTRAGQHADVAAAFESLDLAASAFLESRRVAASEALAALGRADFFAEVARAFEAADQEGERATGLVNETLATAPTLGIAAARRARDELVGGLRLIDTAMAAELHATRARAAEVLDLLRHSKA